MGTEQRQYLGAGDTKKLFLNLREQEKPICFSGIREQVPLEGSLIW